MADNRRKYTKEFKEEAIRLLNPSGKNGHLLEKELGIGSGLIDRWRKELGREGVSEPSRATASPAMRSFPDCEKRTLTSWRSGKS